MAPTNSKIDWYFSKAKQWKAEIAKLRTIMLGCDLTEEMKWGKPCYMFEKSNLIVIVAFKEHAALIFFKGALLNDTEGLLIQPGEESQSARQMRFTSVEEIEEKESIIKAFVSESVEVQKAGLKVEMPKSTQLVYSEELEKKLDEIPEFRAAFEALTPGRRRAYNMHFSAPKQSKTRESRIEKCMQDIYEGKGINDDYLATKKK